MFRILGGLLVVALVAPLLFYIVGEMRLNQGSTATPVSMSLAALEDGEELSNYHVVLDDHLALYPAAGFEYFTHKSKKEEARPPEHQGTSSVFYPIISLDHPDADATVRALGRAARNGHPVELDIPISVIVETLKFDKIGEIPSEVHEVENVQGLFVQSVGSLEEHKVNALRQSFPSLDMNRVLLLREGKKPRGMGVLILIALGLGLVLLIGGWMVVGAVKEMF